MPRTPRSCAPPAGRFAALKSRDSSTAVRVGIATAQAHPSRLPWPGLADLGKRRRPSSSVRMRHPAARQIPQHPRCPTLGRPLETLRIRRPRPGPLAPRFSEQRRGMRSDRGGLSRLRGKAPDFGEPACTPAALGVYWMLMPSERLQVAPSGRARSCETPRARWSPVIGMGRHRTKPGPRSQQVEQPPP